METRAEHRARRKIAGVSMLFAPIFLLLADLFSPKVSDDATTVVNRLVTDHDAASTFGFMGLIGAVLLVPAVFGLMHLVRERAPRVEILGGTLAVIGAVAVAAFMGMRLIGAQIGDLVAGGADKAPFVDLVDRVVSPTGVMVAPYVGLAAFAVGIVLISYAMISYGTAPKLASLLVGVGALVSVIGHLSYGPSLVTIGSIAFTVGMFLVATEVLLETDEAWEHPTTDHARWGDIMPQH